jgi:quinoprotein glucose dehydrogenase
MDSFVSDPSAPVVVAALQSGAALRVDGLVPRLESLRTHASPLVRTEAARLLAASRPVVIAERIAALRQGAVAERQSALADLGASSDAQARTVLGEWVQRLIAGKVEPALQLDVIEAARAAKLPLTAWTNTLSKTDPFAALRPALQGGNAARGRKVFVERQDLACFRCHKLKGEGGDVGPELAGIGKTRGREYVLQSILQPNAQIAQGFENVVLTRKGGSEVSGMLKSETATELVVQTAEDGLVKVPKSDVMSRQRGPSSMPEGLGDLISPLDLRDLIEALSE